MENRTTIVVTLILWGLVLIITIGLSIPIVFIFEKLMIPPFLSAILGVSIVSVKLTKSRLLTITGMILLSLICFIYYVNFVVHYKPVLEPSLRIVVLSWLVSSAIFLLFNLVLVCGIIKFYIEEKSQNLTSSNIMSRANEHIPIVEVYPFESYLTVE